MESYTIMLTSGLIRFNHSLISNAGTKSQVFTLYHLLRAGCIRSRSRSRLRPLTFSLSTHLPDKGLRSFYAVSESNLHPDLNLNSEAHATLNSRPRLYSSFRSRSRSVLMQKDSEMSQTHSQVPGAEKRNKAVVCIEGNIGCGKTTLLNYFQNFSNCEVIPEPVERWRNVDGYNALDMMYKDPVRWGMALQTYIQLTMLQGHTSSQTKDVKLLERSIYSAKYCFTDNLFESDNMPGIEHVILTKWFDWIVQTQGIQVDLIVYLRTDPESLHKRIMTRCRKEEERIPVELLKRLHQKYEDWLIYKKHPCPADVLVIDANQSLEEMKECYEMHKSKILVSQAVK